MTLYKLDSFASFSDMVADLPAEPPAPVKVPAPAGPPSLIFDPSTSLVITQATNDATTIKNLAGIGIAIWSMLK
jgi:hypothetical protein